MQDQDRICLGPNWYCPVLYFRTYASWGYIFPIPPFVKQDLLYLLLSSSSNLLPLRPFTMFGRSQEKESAVTDMASHEDPLAAIPKTRWERLWPVLACGSGLFSDGYINNVSHPARETLKTLKPLPRGPRWLMVEGAP